jgi:hypothetical protein
MHPFIKCGAAKIRIAAFTKKARFSNSRVDEVVFQGCCSTLFKRSIGFTKEGASINCAASLLLNNNVRYIRG